MQTLFRRWINKCLMKLGEDPSAIDGLNTDKQWKTGSTATLMFHWVMKNPLRKACRMIIIPDTWIENLTGNRKLLWKIIDSYYVQNENQKHRRNLVVPAAKYALCLAEYDGNYAEIVDVILLGIVKNHELFKFDNWQLNPENWYRDDTGHRLIKEDCQLKIHEKTSTYIDIECLSGAATSAVMSYPNERTGNLEYLFLDVNTKKHLGDGIWRYNIRKTGTIDEVKLFAESLGG